MPTAPFRVVVAGGGVAGIEALLALSVLAGDRVSLTLLSPDDRFRLRALAVAEPFGLGHVREVPYTRIAEDLGVTHIASSAVAVDDQAGEVRAADGAVVGFDALLLAPGATPTNPLEHAMTWHPDGQYEAFSGLLRDLEDGYLRRVAFVVPPGPTWPLPAYELALMTAREASGMGIDAEISVVTAESDPLALFGLAAAGALRDELDAAGVRLVTGTVAHLERRPSLHLAPDSPGDAIAVDRVVVMPELRGPAIAGIPCDDHGFICTGVHGLVNGCSRTWAAGDGVASALKLGGLAAHQAGRAARDIAIAAGADVPHTFADDELVLDAVLMTGDAPAALDDRPLGPAPGAPRWWPARKVASRYLEGYLARTPENYADHAAQRGSKSAGASW